MLRDFLLRKTAIFYNSLVICKLLLEYEDICIMHRMQLIFVVTFKKFVFYVYCKMN
jgi:hypothetical protein